MFVLKYFLYYQQANITVDNVISVSDNLTDLVISATDTADQNTDNIRIVSTILTQTATLLSDPTVILSLSQPEVSMVRMQQNTL